MQTKVYRGKFEIFWKVCSVSKSQIFFSLIFLKVVHKWNPTFKEKVAGCVTILRKRNCLAKKFYNVREKMGKESMSQKFFKILMTSFTNDSQKNWVNMDPIFTQTSQIFFKKKTFFIMDKVTDIFQLSSFLLNS